MRTVDSESDDAVDVESDGEVDVFLWYGMQLMESTVFIVGFDIDWFVNLDVSSFYFFQIWLIILRIAFYVGKRSKYEKWNRNKKHLNQNACFSLEKYGTLGSSPIHVED